MTCIITPDVSTDLCKGCIGENTNYLIVKIFGGKNFGGAFNLLKILPIISQMRYKYIGMSTLSDIEL